MWGRKARRITQLEEDIYISKKTYENLLNYVSDIKQYSGYGEVLEDTGISLLDHLDTMRQDVLTLHNVRDENKALKLDLEVVQSENDALEAKLRKKAPKRKKR